MIVDRVVSEADKDNDGYINFDEFKNAINKLNVEQKMAFIGFK
jgi:Ca2+-binding EF-hand superfamily protein